MYVFCKWWTAVEKFALQIYEMKSETPVVKKLMLLKSAQRMHVQTERKLSTTNTVVAMTMVLGLSQIHV